MAYQCNRLLLQHLSHTYVAHQRRKERLGIRHHAEFLGIFGWAVVAGTAASSRSVIVLFWSHRHSGRWVAVYPDQCCCSTCGGWLGLTADYRFICLSSAFNLNPLSYSSFNAWPTIVWSLAWSVGRFWFLRPLAAVVVGVSDEDKCISAKINFNIYIRFLNSWTYM